LESNNFGYAESTMKVSGSLGNIVVCADTHGQSYLEVHNLSGFSSLKIDSQSSGSKASADIEMLAGQHVINGILMSAAAGSTSSLDINQDTFGGSVYVSGNGEIDLKIQSDSVSFVDLNGSAGFNDAQSAFAGHFNLVFDTPSNNDNTSTFSNVIEIEGWNSANDHLVFQNNSGGVATFSPPDHVALNYAAFLADANNALAGIGAGHDNDYFYEQVIRVGGGVDTYVAYNDYTDGHTQAGSGLPPLSTVIIKLDNVNDFTTSNIHDQIL
jgi:hypothetical protein